MTEEVGVLAVGPEDDGPAADLTAERDLDVSRAGSPGAARAAVESAPIDVVVCDAGHADPFAVLGQVRELAPGLPMVVTTADHQPPVAVRASRSDRVEYLPDAVAADGELPDRVRALAGGRGDVATHGQALVELQAILADDATDVESAVDRLLELGCRYLDTDVGFLSTIDVDDDRFAIEQAIGDHEHIQPGATDSLSNTYCRRAIEGDGLLGVVDATVDPGWTDDPAYRKYGLGCYIGARIEVDGDLYGTLCFADESPRDRRFSAHEEAFVELVVEWLEEELARRAYRDELGAAREDLRRTLERIGDGFLSIDDDWQVTHLNERAEEILGLDRAELVGAVLWDAFPEATEEQFYAEYHRAMETQEPVTFEERHEPLDTWFEVRAYPAPDGLSVFFRDVTDRRERERRLQRTEARYRTLAENLPNGAVFLVDADRRFQVVSGGGLADTPLDPADLEGRPVTDPFDADLSETVVDLVDAALDGETMRTEVPFAGNVYQVNAAPVTDADGAVVAAMAVATDVTEIRERERAVREIYEVIADPDRTFDAKVQALLEIGCDRLGTDYGSLSEIDGEDYRFQVVEAPHDTMEAGDTVSLSATNCERTAATEETLVLSDVAREAPELTSKAGYTDWGIACYLGAPVYAGGAVYGTFCFYDDEPRTEPFSDWETTLVDLMSQWVSYELERGERERALERYESVLETIRDPIYAVDESLRFRLVTEPLAASLGYDRQALSGRPVADVLDADTAEAFEAAVADLRDGDDEATALEGTCVTAGDGEFPVEIGVSVPADGAGFVGSMRDITARRERQRDLKFFYELVAAAGVGIVAVDEAGRIEYHNDAAADLLGAPLVDAGAPCIDDVLADGAVLGPDAVSEAVGFDDYGVVWDRVSYDESTVIEATADRGDGDAVPVELRLTKQAIEGEAYLFGTVVDVSERKQMATIRQTLSEAAGAMLESGEAADTYERALAAARTITDVPAGVAYRFDDERGALVPEAATDDLVATAEDVPTLTGGESRTWQAFVEGRIRSTSDIAGPLVGEATPDTTATFVPLGEHGVVALLADADRTPSERQREALEILAANVEADLDRTARAEALQDRERELAARTERLERLNRVSSVVRSIAAVVVQESDREGIKAAVADRLVGVEPFGYVWVGDDGPGGPTAAAWAGESTVFDDPTDARGAAHPARRAAESGEVDLAANLMTVPEADRAVWQAAALERGYPSVCAVPLAYEGTTRGVLVVYADRVGVFDEDLRSLLAELGEMIGYALTAAEHRAALASERTVELTFDVPEGAAFASIAARLDCTVELKRVRSGPDATTVTYLLEDLEPDALEDLGAALPGGTTATSTRLDDDTALVELAVGGEWIGTPFAAEGGRVEAATADPSSGELVASLPLGIEVRPVVESLQAAYPDVELVAKRERERERETPSMLRGGVAERLTDKQLDVLETAYLAGFFDQPRTSSGADVADLLDVSQPTFNQQRRAAVRKLVAFLLENPSA